MHAEADLIYVGFICPAHFSACEASVSLSFDKSSTMQKSTWPPILFAQEAAS
jgi:hypothetical protein